MSHPVILIMSELKGRQASHRVLLVNVGLVSLGVRLLHFVIGEAQKIERYRPSAVCYKVPVFNILWKGVLFSSSRSIHLRAHLQAQN